ncbi:hypothetical protein BKA61DRAFT_644619 [Leptodontidium sp. MPI-SDFR-AT-0119]|nr:hypothetical protein BKA61DRAFT_644619 [Leptodontidium sp. MPI-SDFR-AT-0119]
MGSIEKVKFPVWDRFVRFTVEDGQEYCGEPVDSELDIGLAFVAKEPILIKVLDSSSALDIHASFTGDIKTATSILTPVTAQEVGTIRCVGLNYTDHAAEMKLALPTHPEIFMKPDTCVHSPILPITLPKNTSEECDPEVELAVVIGKTCKDVSPDEALDYVLGYMTANDVTARKIQGRGSQWGYSKGFDGFCPMGPCLVSTKSIPDPSVLLLRTTLDGKVMQNGAAKNLIFSAAECVSHISQGTTLRRGTVILTGTPAGIGHSYIPPIYLKKGADLKIWISHGLGTLVNEIKQGA